MKIIVLENKMSDDIDDYMSSSFVATAHPQVIIASIFYVKMPSLLPLFSLYSLLSHYYLFPNFLAVMIDLM